MQQQLRLEEPEPDRRLHEPKRQRRTSDDRRAAAELLQTPGALLNRSHLRGLGLERRAIDAVFRALPVVALPGYSRPLIRAERIPRARRASTPTATTASAPVVPSVWIERRESTDGGARYLVKFRLGGRESAHRYAGSFATRREALARQRWVSGELAAMRVPRVGHRDGSASAPTLAEVAERWRASRVDVTEGTAVGHRVQLARVLRLLGTRPVDEITPADVAGLVTALHEAGRKRETIRKSLTVLAQVLDFAGIKDNPARDRIHVRLPRQEREEPNLQPPTRSRPSCR